MSTDPRAGWKTVETVYSSRACGGTGPKRFQKRCSRGLIYEVKSARWVLSRCDKTSPCSAGDLKRALSPLGPLRRSTRYAALGVWTFPRRNPKGISAQSPGLRGTSYPGKMDAEPHNPNGVAPDNERNAMPASNGKGVMRTSRSVSRIWNRSKNTLPTRRNITGR